MTPQKAKNLIVGCVIPNFDKESLFGSYVIDALKMAISALEKLDSVPSAQSEIIHCKNCKHHHYDKNIPYCDRIDYGYGWKDDDFCSRAERREV